MANYDATTNDPALRQSPTLVGHGVHALLSWRSIFAGLFVSFLVFAILFTLGVGIGGLSLSNVIQDGGAQALGIGSGIWAVAMTLIALFAGCYFAARVSGAVTGRIGMAHGLVIASIFFAVMFVEMTMTAGMATRGAGAVIGQVGGVAGDVADNPQVRSLIESSLGNLNLKAEPDVVARGLATRLIRGDMDSAKNYLAYQAGVTPTEAEQRLSAIQAQVEEEVKQAGTTAAQVISGIGWTLFAILLLGSIAGAVGGSIGARANRRRPFAESTVIPIEHRRSA